jgi:hypothetical protein
MLPVLLQSNAARKATILVTVAFIMTAVYQLIDSQVLQNPSNITTLS